MEPAEKLGWLLDGNTGGRAYVQNDRGVGSHR